MNDQFPSTDAEFAAMPPPPPRPRASTTDPSPMPLMASPTTEVERANDSSSLETIEGVAVRGIFNANNDNNAKRKAIRRHTPEDGYPPRPPAKRQRLGAAPRNTDKENTINNADSVSIDEGKEEEEDQDELVYSDPEGDDEKESKESALSEIDSMMKMGLQAFQDRERLQQEITFFRDDNAAKNLEISRLRAALKQKQEIVTNLFQSVEASKTEACQSSRATVTEATLRADLSNATELKNKALAQAADAQRKVGRLEEQTSQLKAKLTRVTQEKFKLEREQRAAQHLARSVDQQSSVDVEFYKRKVTELTGQVQSLNGLVLDKNRIIEDMQRQLERSLSRQAAAAKRRSADNGKNSSKSL